MLEVIRAFFFSIRFLISMSIKKIRWKLFESEIHRLPKLIGLGHIGYLSSIWVGIRIWITATIPDNLLTF